MQNAYQGLQTIAKWSNLEVLTSATAVTARSELFSFIFKALLFMPGSNFYIFLTKIKCPGIILFSIDFKI